MAFCLTVVLVQAGTAVASCLLRQDREAADLVIEEVTVDGLVDNDRTSALEDVTLQITADRASLSVWDGMELVKWTAVGGE